MGTILQTPLLDLLCSHLYLRQIEWEGRRVNKYHGRVSHFLEKCAEILLKRIFF